MSPRSETSLAIATSSCIFYALSSRASSRAFCKKRANQERCIAHVTCVLTSICPPRCVSSIHLSLTKKIHFPDDLSPTNTHKGTNDHAPAQTHDTVHPYLGESLVLEVQAPPGDGVYRQFSTHGAAGVRDLEVAPVLSPFLPARHVHGAIYFMSQGG